MIKEIEKILVPGIYKGEGYTSPTIKYPNGVFLKIKSNKITKDTKRDMLKATIEGKGYDRKTKEKLFDYKRVSIFYEDSNDKSKYFYDGKTFINNKVACSTYGYVSNINPESKTMTIKLVYSYFVITNVVYTDSSLIIKRDSKEKTIVSTFKLDEKHKGEKPNVHLDFKFFQQSK
mgnify:CR=1 FL=1